MSLLDKKVNGIISQSDLKKPSVRILYYGMFLVCLLITIISIAPPIWVFLSSFKDIKEFTRETTLLPKKIDFGLLKKTWVDLGFYKYYLNSFYVVAGSVICAIIFNGLLAYAISIIKPKGSKAIYGMILGSLMIPATTSIVPLFMNLNKLHLTGTFYPLWFVIGANAFFVVLYKEFFDTLPKSVIEGVPSGKCGYTTLRKFS